MIDFLHIKKVLIVNIHTSGGFIFVNLRRDQSKVISTAYPA